MRSAAYRQRPIPLAAPVRLPGGLCGTQRLRRASPVVSEGVGALTNPQDRLVPTRAPAPSEAG